MGVLERGTGRPPTTTHGRLPTCTRRRLLRTRSGPDLRPLLGGEVVFVVCVSDSNHSRRVSGSVARRRARRSWSVRAEPESRKQCNGRQGAVLAPSALHQGQNGWQKRVLRQKLALEPIPWGLGSPGAVVVAPFHFFALYASAGCARGRKWQTRPRPRVTQPSFGITFKCFLEWRLAPAAQ